MGHSEGNEEGPKGQEQDGGEEMDGQSQQKVKEADKEVMQVVYNGRDPDLYGGE